MIEINKQLFKTSESMAFVENEATDFFGITIGGGAKAEGFGGGVQRAPPSLKRSFPTKVGMRSVSEATILDTYKNNCNNFNCQFDKKNWYFLNVETGQKIKYFCKSWNCATCEPGKRWKMKQVILEVCFLHNCQYFTTLTIPTASAEEGKGSFNYISHCFRKLSIMIKRKYGSWIYIRINESTKKGYAHLHIIHKERLNVNWLRKSWVNCGGGKIMKLEVIGSKKIKGKGHYKTDFEGLTAYLTSYLSKANLQLPKGVRHWSTNIKIAKKEEHEKPKGVWILKCGEAQDLNI